MSKPLFLVAALASLALPVASLRSAPPTAGDTRETLANPEALRQAIPRLAAQHAWTEYATPEQIKLFDGPETVWPEVPADQYDLSSFDSSALGSKVPAPGVHPRILFSPEDIPAVRQRILGTKNGKKAMAETACVLDRTLFNPQSDEGKIFAKLAGGDVADLKWPADEGKTGNEHYFAGYTKQLLGSMHNGYLPHLLAAAAMQCLINGDDARGKQVATAIYNYYKLREPLVDRLNNDFNADGIAPNDEWRPMHQLVGNNNLSFCYDIAAPWMSDDQKQLMRRVISKATKGKLGYGMNGPVRWCDTNWVGWDMECFLTSLAIEGEEGYDPAIYPAAKRTLTGYLTWGFSPSGTIFETNGKNGAGLEYALLSMVAMARRGDNLFGHPYLHGLTTMQTQAVIPAGGTNVNNGTWGNAPFGGSLASTLKTFFPKDQKADWLMRQVDSDLAEFDPAAYEQKLKDVESHREILWKRLDVITAPRLFGLLDWQGLKDDKGKLLPDWDRTPLHLPLAYNDPVHGLLETRSGDDKDALFMMFEARPDLRGVGHQHHDSGHFYLAADGEMWAVEAGPKNSFSIDHNTVQIDGRGHSDASAAPRVEYLPATVNDRLSIASADLKNAYDYAWTTPMHFSWLTSDCVNGTWKLSPETDPLLVAYYRGTQHYKMRIWGNTYWDNNWGPAMRIAGNPVQYAYRSAGIIRGTHPYAIVTDDISKDGKSHQYDWLMQVPDAVRIAGVQTPKGAVPSVALTKTPAIDNWRERGSEVLPKNSPALLACLLDDPQQKEVLGGNTVAADDLPFHLDHLAYLQSPDHSATKSRLVITRHAVDPMFRVLLIPFRGGEALPTVTWNAAANTAKVEWKDQTDVIAFKRLDNRTTLGISRDGKTGNVTEVTK